MQEPGPDGGRRIIIATDRPLGFAETSNRSRTVDYPFTVIDMQMPAKGHGEGTMSLAARIIPTGKNIVVDSKVSLAAYLEAAETSDETVREARLDAHARHLREHVDRLAGKFRVRDVRAA